MWVQLAAMAVQLMGNMEQEKAKEKQNRLDREAVAKANAEEIRATALENMIGRTNAESSNKVREANNELAAVVGSLNRFRIGLGDRQALRTSGREQEQIQTNLFRAVQDANRGKLEQRLDTAHDLGALAASTAAAGVGGGSKEVMNATIRMTNARRLAALAEAEDQMTYDGMKLLTNTQADAYAQLDTSVIFDQLDFQIDTFIPRVPAIQQGPAKIGGGMVRAGVRTVTQNPELTQQLIGSFRSTGSNNSARAPAPGSLRL